MQYFWSDSIAGCSKRTCHTDKRKGDFPRAAGREAKRRSGAAWHRAHGKCSPVGCAPAGLRAPLSTQSRSRSGGGGGRLCWGRPRSAELRPGRAGRRRGGGGGRDRDRRSPLCSALGRALGAGRRPDEAARPAVGSRAARGRAVTTRGRWARRGGTHHCGGRGLPASPLRPAAGRIPLLDVLRPRRSVPAPSACSVLSCPVCLSVRPSVLPVRGAARARRRPSCGSCRRCQDAVTMGTERRGARRSLIYRQRPPQPLPPRRRGSPAPRGARTAAGLVLSCPVLSTAALRAGGSSGAVTDPGRV